jgi:hypothetical protein
MVMMVVIVICARSPAAAREAQAAGWRATKLISNLLSAVGPNGRGRVELDPVNARPLAFASTR